MKYVGVTILCLGGWAGSLPAQTGAGKPSPGSTVVVPVPLSTMIDHNSQLIAFLCGGTLTAEERRRIAAFAATEVRRDANTWYKNDAEISKDLKSIRENPGAISAELWLKWRLKYRLVAAEDVEAQIVAAHDPVLELIS